VKVDYASADLTKASEIESMMSLAPYDILVNNAGIQHVSPLESFQVPAPRANGRAMIRLVYVV
jgi:short-subunit dehydrogenase